MIRNPDPSRMLIAAFVFCVVVEVAALAFALAMNLALK